MNAGKSRRWYPRKMRLTKSTSTPFAAPFGAFETPFVVSSAGEPHRERRLRLLRAHPAIAHLFGPDVRTAWVTLVVFLVHVAAAFVLGRGLTSVAAASKIAAWGLAFACAYTFGAILSHWLGMTIHETAHDLAFRSRSLNRALAFFANVPMLVPIAMTFHRYHLEHHRQLGVLERDTDLPTEWEARFVGTSAWRKFAWLGPYMITYGLRGLTFAKRPNRAELVNVGVQVLATAALYALTGPWGIVYLALSTFIGHSLHPVAAHFIHEHYTFAKEQETYSYYGLLNAFTFNVGYHVEHHDFMNVSGWRLPELKALAGGEYERLQSHSSWTWVLWHFVTSESIGVASRIVRHHVLGARRVVV